MDTKDSIIKAQCDLIVLQGKLIDQLIKERDEAIYNLKIASLQWEIWRKEIIDG